MSHLLCTEFYLLKELLSNVKLELATILIKHPMFEKCHKAPILIERKTFINHKKNQH